MARIADPEKMDNIKKAVMECLIDYGYAGVTSALICEKAGVSPGYLYRYYESKEKLIEELVDSEMQVILANFESNINTSSTIYEVAYRTVKKLFMKANEDKLAAKFASCVVMDLRVPAKEKADNYKKVMELAEKCIELGGKTGDIDPKITATEVIVVSFTIPFRYLSLSLELDENKKFTEDEVERIAKICVKAFK